MLGDSVVLRDPLANFGGRDAHDGIRRGIIVGASPEHLDADGTFLQLIGVSREGVVTWNASATSPRAASMGSQAFITRHRTLSLHFGQRFIAPLPIRSYLGCFLSLPRPPARKSPYAPNPPGRRR